jgi:hypothetical protein
VRVRLKTDASAAKGIASRKRLGKARHIEVNQLWLQDKLGSDHCAKCEPAEHRAQRKRCKGWSGSKSAYTPGSLGTSSRKGESVLPGNGEGSGVVALTSIAATTPSKAGMPPPSPTPAAAIRPRTAVNRSGMRSKANVRKQELSQRRCFARPEDYAYIGQVNRNLVKDVHPKTRQKEAIAWLEARCGGHLLQASKFHYKTENGISPLNFKMLSWR